MQIHMEKIICPTCTQLWSGLGCNNYQVAASSEHRHQAENLGVTSCTTSYPYHRGCN